MHWHWFEDHFQPIIEVDDPNKLLTMNGQIIKKCGTCFPNKNQIKQEELQKKEILCLINKSIEFTYIYTYIYIFCI